MGSEPDRLTVVGDGAVEVALVAVGVAPVVEGHGVFRIDADRLIVVGDGAVEVALVAVDDTSIVEGHDVFGIVSDRFIEVGDGVVQVALVAITVTSIGVVNRLIASIPFPGIDALGTGNDQRLGVMQSITLVSGG